MKYKLPGFSLIEIIVVITLFAITSIAVTTSYVSYEQREKLKNGALQIKSDLRLAQSRALNGDKGLGQCSTLNNLLGWYVNFDTDAGSTYEIAGICLDTAGAETKFGPEIIKLPDGVKISAINTSADNDVSILFRPLDFKVTFHDDEATLASPPDFWDPTINNFTVGNLVTLSESTITLSNDDGNYEVKINSSGQVREVKL